MKSLVGSSPGILEVKRIIAAVAESSSSVLITGESGTGKEVVARALHACGPRSTKPFVPINCGAIPRDLIESELFGHKRGAFTGAVTDRVGRFEYANGGTLFLDEIGELGLSLQVKLLRALQDKRIIPVGTNKEIDVDVRVVAASNINFSQALASGQFREDLYYRINVLPIKVIPLRERLEDIPALVDHFLSSRVDDPVKKPRFSVQLMELLSRYSWPGNVRELANVVERFQEVLPGQDVSVGDVPEWLLPEGLAVLRGNWLSENLGVSAQGLSSGTATSSSSEEPAEHDLLDITPEQGNSGVVDDIEEIVRLTQGNQIDINKGFNLRETITKFERLCIEQAMAKSGGNITQAAGLLMMQRTTMIEKMNRLGLRR